MAKMSLPLMVAAEKTEKLEDSVACFAGHNVQGVNLSVFNFYQVYLVAKCLCI